MKTPLPENCEFDSYEWHGNEYPMEPGGRGEGSGYTDSLGYVEMYQGVIFKEAEINILLDRRGLSHRLDAYQPKR